MYVNSRVHILKAVDLVLLPSRDFEAVEAIPKTLRYVMQQERKKQKERE
jgi:hypothetical protein